MLPLLTFCLLFPWTNGELAEVLKKSGTVRNGENFNATFNHEGEVVAVELESNADPNYPLFVVVQSEQQIHSWTIPYETTEGRVIRTGHKTLCLPGRGASVEIFTRDQKPAWYNLTIVDIQKQRLEIGKPINISIKPLDQVVYHVLMPPDQLGVVVKVDSDDNICATVSLENINSKNCTYGSYAGTNDRDTSNHKMQTMTKQATVTAVLSEIVYFNNASDFAVFIRLPTTNRACRKKIDAEVDLTSQTSPKNVTITLEILDKRTYWAILWFPLIIMAIVCVILAACMWPPVAKYMQHPAPPVYGRPNLSPKIIVDPPDMVKGSFFVSLLVIAVLYAAPALQLLLKNQELFYVTGDEDACYYNFRCLRPLGPFIAFNNVYSNIGYMLFGAFFLVLVWYHKRRFTWRYREIFYALGLALFLEGCMSGGYHVCPSSTNFQFDTTFMYIIAILCIYHMYHIRNPIRPARPHMAYGVIACAVFYVVLSLLSSNKVFHIVLAVVYALTAIAIGVFVTKRIYLDNEALQGNRWMVYTMTSLHIIINVLLVAASCYFLIKNHLKFPSMLLYLFIGNMFYFGLFYFIVKWKNREVLVVGSFCCVFICLISWAFSLYFFMIRRVTQWSESPAQSRERNKDCVFLDFFDDHDVWHMLSSFSIFISFMLLLVLDAATALGSGGRTISADAELKRAGGMVFSTIDATANYHGAYSVPAVPVATHYANQFKSTITIT